MSTETKGLVMRNTVRRQRIAEHEEAIRLIREAIDRDTKWTEERHVNAPATKCLAGGI